MIFDTIIRKAGKAMKGYEMLEDNDKILIGLSGGKDSLALVEVLANRQKIYKPKIEVIACHIYIKNIGYQSDIEYLKNFCQDHDIKFIHSEISIQEDTKKNRNQCFLCSWFRRKQLFKIAEENGCNKIALGHHKDDAIETLLMNQIYQGTFSTMPPKLVMKNYNVTIIRPLILLREQEITELSNEHNYKKQVKNCPYEKESKRDEIKVLIKTLEKMNPNVMSSIYNSMTNIQSEYLPNKIEDTK